MRGKEKLNSQVYSKNKVLGGGLAAKIMWPMHFAHTENTSRRCAKV